MALRPDRQRHERALIVRPTVRVVLHGRLRKQFGHEFNLGITTPAAAVRALVVMHPQLRESLAAGQYRVRRGKYRKGFDLPEHGLIMRLPPGGELHIIPVAKGAKSGMGLGKVILGAALIAAAFIVPEIAPSLATGTLFGAGITAPLALAGGALVLSGVISILSPQPKTYRQEQSWIIDGLQNVATQGIPVPVIYGRVRVGSIVVSVGYTAADYTPEYYVPPRPEDYPAFYGGATPWGTSTVLAGSSDDMTAGTGSTSTGPGTTLPSLSSFTKTTGAGGSGKGGPVAGGSVIENDTLFSNATVQIIDVLCEGPIGGLVNGGQSIFFDGTPLQADDNTFNFYGVTWTIRLGYPDQDPVSGFPASQTSTAINLQVKQATPIIQRITGVAATAAQVTMEIPAAYSIDVHTGDVSYVTIEYKIECRPSQLASPGFTGDWVEVIHVLNTGAKSSSPYQKSSRFDLDTSNNADTWDIRVTRITADSDDTAHLQNDTYWQLLDIIVDHQIMYSNSAYIALQIDTQAFGGSSIPVRTYELYGLQIAVPANYSVAPTSGSTLGARTYATSGVGTSGGTWDLASFNLLPSDNPAFILFDMLQKHRYGCGLPQPALEGILPELYVIAQYADAFVPDGFGGEEPRYSVNVAITNQDSAYNVIGLIASAMRAMTYWGNGQVFVSADMPLSPAMVANQTNITDDGFEYSGTSLKTRPNLVRVSYLDSTNRYLQTIEPVPNAQDIAVRGAVIQDIVGWGITTRGRAHRLGKWVIYTAFYQTETVTFKGGFDWLGCRPGMIIKQSDPYYAGARMAGRLRSTSTTTVLALDSVFVQDGSSAYTITVVMPDGTVDSNVAISSFVDAGASPDYTIVHLATALTQQPTPNAPWIITSTNLSPRQFQVLAVGEDQKGVYAVTAVNYDINKFDIVEDGLNFVSPTYSTLPALLTSALPAPTNVAVTDYLTGVGSTQQLIVITSWTTPTDPRIGSYQVYASATGYYKVYTSQVGALEITDIPVTDSGLSFTFGVRSVAAGGQTSAWATYGPVTIDGQAVTPPAPSGLAAIGGTRSVSISWIAIPNRGDILQYNIYRASVSTTGPGAGATLVASVSATSYLDAQSTVLTPNTTWYYWVTAVADGSPTVEGPAAGPVSATTTLLVAADLEAGIISTASFAEGLKAVQIVANLNTITDIGGNAIPIGGYVVNEVDSQLYVHVTEGSGALGDLFAYNYAISLDATSGQITTTQITDNAITTGKIAAGSIGTDQLQADSVTSAIIAAGAVTATQIAAGQIHASMLASDFQLTESSQIGNLVVTNAQIANLTVQTSNIGAAQITQTAQSYTASPSTGTTTTPAANGTVTVTVPTYGKVILMLSITQTPSSYFDAGGGGAEG